jgi:choline-sulfatase
MRVLILDLDTLRPDHLGCYGYHRDTSPNIDRIASEGVRFDNYFVPDAPCLPARAALISGQHGIHNGAIGHGGTAADMRIEGQTRGFRSWWDSSSLWSIFRRAGMHTCSISPFGERHTSMWFYSGLNEMHNTGQGGNESAEEITPLVERWLNANGKDDNWLLHINYWDPHTHYRAPEAFGNPFADEPIEEWYTEELLEEHKTLAGPHTCRDNNMYDGNPMPQYPRHVPDIQTMSDLKKHIDGYDCGIRYMDGHIGQILNQLDRLGVLDDTAIIVTSDHGENQGELGIYAEHGTADQITHRIPMIVRWPGGQKGHVDSGFHYNFDLSPTLAELFGQAPQPRWHGESYAAAIKTGEATGHEELILSQGAHVCQRSVRWGDWLYMHTYHDGYRPHMNKEMLFNISEDPHELADLAEAKPEICGEGARRLEAWHARMMQTMPDGYTVDPMQTVLAEGGPSHAQCMLDSYAKHLEETGRGHWIPELRKRHPAKFSS